MPSTQPTTSRRRALSLSALAVGSALGGCTSLFDDGPPTAERQVSPDWRPSPGQWSTWNYDFARTSHNPFAEPPRREPSPAWTYDVEESVDSLVVAKDTVFVGTEGEIVALRASTGDLQWRQSMPNGPRLTWIDGRLYGATGNELRAYTSDGDREWTYRRDEDQMQFFDVLERRGTVYLLFRNHIERIHADTGTKLGAQSLYGRFPVTTGGLVYASEYAIEAYEVDGKFDSRWSVLPENARQTYTYSAIANGLLYRPEYEPVSGPARLAIYDADSGTARERVPLEHTPRSPAVGADRSFVSTSVVTADEIGSEGNLLALSADGKRRWEYDAAGSLGPPAVANGTVFVGPFANGRVPLLAFDAENGDELWRLPISGSTLAIAGDTLYVSANGTVRALRR
ncbi:outer membrane protein assembly factor BamB family protein [Salinarchaeum laminariae]|uniref:outer membrane protein assembly factor BamB family protein n=1 Tax=Salinarchaeum laminariae TaxID=869888 RepID=UPI0020BF3A94|nr:PQQ-binding-like beta-propeller repeat protein [Salinarchaeum laminariae]